MVTSVYLFGCNELPAITTMIEQEKAFEELLSYRDKLDKIEYDDIKALFRESIKQIPIATAKIHKNALIDRVRLNREIDFFTKQSDLSYITDQDVIDNYMKEFGRANKPFQPLFYGALESSRIKQNRLTALYETSNLIHDTEAVNLEGELATLSRWIVQEEMIIAEIVFSDEAIANNPDIYRSFQNQYKQIMKYENREFALKLLQFFSDEFARKTLTHHDYKLSVAYSELIMYEKGLPGITYPSVKSGFQGQNIVLRPDVVNDNLILETVSTHRLHKNGMNALFNNYYHTQNFGENNEAFKWNTDECDEKELIKQSIERVSSK